MNRYDARNTFVEYLEQYIAGIETDERLSRACELVSAYHDPLTGEACDLVKAVLESRRSFHGSYAEAAQVLRERLSHTASSQQAA
jgi:hypothetical protein